VPSSSVLLGLFKTHPSLLHPQMALCQRTGDRTPPFLRDFITSAAAMVRELMKSISQNYNNIFGASVHCSEKYNVAFCVITRDVS